MQLLKYFHELTLHPANAKQLKGLILQLAIQGDLTKKWRSENPNCESQTELIERLKKEKATLLIENDVKNEEPINPISAVEIKYELPTDWLWCRFSEVAYIVRGGSPRPIKDYITSDPDGLNWIKIGDTKSNPKYIEHTQEKIIKEGLKKTRLVNPGDFLLSNSMSFGRPYIMKTTGCIHDGWLLIRVVKNIIDQDYLYHMLSSKYVYDRFKDSAAGGVVQNLNIEKAKQTVIPIPPLDEQKAIVETVDKLFKEVEQLEQLTESRIRIKEQFALSALRRLAENNTPQEWEALQPHFHTFFNHAPNIKKLRETILQLAVQGKLTARWRKENSPYEGGSGHPDNHNAALLLQKIKAEKARLIAEGKIKKEKPLPEISADEIPYKLPEGWVWCRLGHITIKLGAGSTPLGGKNAYVPVGIKFLRSQNVYNDGLRLNEVVLIPDIVHEKMKGTKVRPKDLLLNITGGSIGRCALVPDNFDTANVSQHVAIVRLVDSNFRKYIHTLITSVYFQKTIMDVQVGVSREGLSMTKLKLFLLPLPSLKEQQAIVSTVNLLMALCDSLEKEVASGTARAELWMKGAVREIVEKEY